MLDQALLAHGAKRQWKPYLEGTSTRTDALQRDACALARITSKTMKATASFDVTGWDPTTYDDPDDGPDLTRITITKSFQGDLEGDSVGEGLFCGMKDPNAGAGYVVSERFTGSVAGNRGSFVMQHGGLMGPDVPPHTFGNIVPGSGTGELAGLRGTVSLDRDETGAHSIAVDYELPND